MFSGSNLLPSFYQSSRGIDFRIFDFVANGIPYKIRCSQYFTSIAQFFTWINLQTPVVFTQIPATNPWEYTCNFQTSASIQVSRDAYGFVKLGISKGYLG